MFIFVGDTDFGLDRLQQQKMLLTIKSLRYAASEAVYVRARDAFIQEINKDREEPHPFEKYFMKNWDSCLARWISYLRDDCPDLGNNSNNRLESAWGRQKLDFGLHVLVDQCVESIRATQLYRKQEFEALMNVCFN